MVLEGLLLGLFKFAERKDNAWIGWLADRGLSEHFHWERLILGPWLVVDFSDGGKSELKTWALDVGFDLPTSHTDATNFIFLIQLWGRLGVTTLKDTKICWKPFSASISTSCSHFLHRHKTEPRPERHRLHQEWISYYFPMNSSTHELVRDSQLLHRVKDKSSRWMRTNEIEALKGWKHTCSLWTQKTPFAPTHSMKPLPIPPLAKCSRSQEMLMNGRNGWIYNHSESSITR